MVIASDYKADGDLRVILNQTIQEGHGSGNNQQVQETYMNLKLDNYNQMLEKYSSLVTSVLSSVDQKQNIIEAQAKRIEELELNQKE